MTLNSSGPISMGGATTGQSINLELNQSATAQITLNDSNVRTLAEKASGQIGLSDFYGKSSINQQLWAWGSNVYGQLGIGTNVAKSSPVQVGSLRNWSKVAATGVSSLAIKTDGTLWAWGFNAYGQLGQGNTTTYSSPVQVGALTTWSKITGGSSHAHAIKTDGTLWAWGRNDVGSLGDGTTTVRSSPVQVGASTDWSIVNDGTFHAGAVKTGGTLWMWGYNPYGQLGTNNISNYYSPVQIGSTGWSTVACGDNHTLALKTDGTLWAWGYNVNGELGVDTQQLFTYDEFFSCEFGGSCGGNECCFTNCDVCATLAAQYPNCDITCVYHPAGSYYENTPRSSPVQVGSGFSTISTRSNSSFAIKTDGTLWAWGYNDSGQLGLGNLTSRSSPVQVGTLTTWSRVISGYSSTLAVKNDGTLWAWGINSNGELGTGNLTSYSSPVQVGSSTTWLSTGFAAGLFHALGIRG